MHTNSLLLFDKYARSRFRPGQRVLEIGPDAVPSSFRRRVDLSDLAWDTIDLFPDPKLTFQATSEYSFPIADNSYDLVVSGQVIEHVRKIWVWIKELARVTRPGGHVITVNPVSWPYHEAPIDCWRAYPEGMRALYDEAGLTVEHSSWESLEPEQPGRGHIPGRDRRLTPVWVRWFGGWLGFPDERAYDTITIGRKPE